MKSGFVTEPDLHGLRDGRRFQLTTDLVYDSALLNKRIVVKAGYITDFASVPRWLWWLLPPWGVYGLAAIVHDYLYGEQPDGVTRELADAVFSEAMEELSTPEWKDAAMWLAVRTFGWIVWNRARDKRADQAGA